MIEMKLYHFDVDGYNQHYIVMAENLEEALRHLKSYFKDRALEEAKINKTKKWEGSWRQEIYDKWVDATISNPRKGITLMF